MKVHRHASTALVSPQEQGLGNSQNAVGAGDNDSILCVHGLERSKGRAGCPETG